MSVSPEYRITAEPVGAQLVTGLPFEFLRIPPDQDTQMLSMLLAAALDAGETYTNRVFRLTSFTGLFPCLEYDRLLAINRPFVTIYRSPLVDVQELRVFEEGNDTATVLDAEVLRKPSFSRVFLPKTFSGTLDPDRLLPIEVDFRAGYTTGAAVFPEIRVPPAVKMGLQQHVSYLYENRADVAGDFADAFPEDVKRSYSTVRIIPVGR